MSQSKERCGVMAQRPVKAVQKKSLAKADQPVVEITTRRVEKTPEKFSATRTAIRSVMKRKRSARGVMAQQRLVEANTNQPAVEMIATPRVKRAPKMLLEITVVKKMSWWAAFCSGVKLAAQAVEALGKATIVCVTAVLVVACTAGAPAACAAIGSCAVIGKMALWAKFAAFLAV